jgi:hypothetical protein
MLLSMDWQQAVALSIVAVTAGLFAWVKCRSRKLQWNRATHCGCAATSDSNAAHSAIIFRARKGHVPQVIIKPS